MFTRIAIVNRGEAAMRLIHAVRDLNAEAGSAVRTIALYTDDERTAMFAREADEAHCIGPASARPYIDHAALERALVECRADAVWVGWGFVAEDPAFADLCDRIGVAFIGPSADAMRTLGDKIGSKLIAEEVGVPVAPWSGGEVATLAEALEAAERIGYPLMLKATAGGGGRGIRMVASAADLHDAYLRTREEAERAFGNGAVFLERLVTGARHVEVQVIADGQGTAWAIGVRDCTVQRRNQKVIEESASPLLDDLQAGELKAAAERLVIAVGYAGAGTVEFLYHPGERTFAFLEVNTRLQVEHPITEVTTDTDLVKLQIRIASGEKLPRDRPVEKGHAVEARLNAEDPDRDFAPAPGRIALLELPTGPGIRVDTGVGEGDVIPADFDSMIAKIIAYGPTRDEALARLRRAMAETTVVIEGGATNKSFILDLLQQPEVVGPDVWADTGWIDRARAEGGLVLDKHAGVALAMAGIDAYAEEARVEIARLLETAHGGRPQVQHRVGRAVDFKLRGVAYKVTVIQIGPRRYGITLACGDTSERIEAEVERRDEFHVRLTIGERTYRLVTATHPPTHFIEVDGVAHRVSRDEGGVLRSPAPALVVASPVAVGDVVEAGSPVLVLESMKMETVLRSPYDATVRELLVLAGSQVETGAPLARLEPVAIDGGGESSEQAVAVSADPSTPSLDLPAQVQDLSPADRAGRSLADLSALVMGYDVDPADDGSTVANYLAARADLQSMGVDVLRDELGFLAMFADFAELSRNRPVGEDLHTELRVHSPREHFHTYLHSLDVERGGLPQSFCDRLTRVLSRYGVTGDQRTPELEEAVFRIFLAQQRPGTDVRVVSAVLERWMSEPPPEPDLAGPVREQLERLVRATQLRHPVIGDLARSVRFHWFDQPLVDQERASVLAQVADRVAELAADPELPDRAERIEALAAIPEQIVRFLVERLQAGVPDEEPMLEVMVRLHYREHGLRDVRPTSHDGRPFVLADYTVDGKPSSLVTTIGTMNELLDPAGSLGPGLAKEVAAREPGVDAVVDLYLHWPDAPDALDDVAGGLRDVLAGLPFAHEARRVTVGVSADGVTSGGVTGGVTYFTYRSNGDGTLVEDRLVRGVHRMVARRLNLWRLQDFDVTRLDAPEDVLLYECVAKGNSQDRRLVALAQVRQLAVVRDESGVVIGLPHAERAIENCLEAVRRTRTARGAAGTKLDMNHIWVQVWPVVDADLDQLAALQSKITPLSDGAGIEEVLVQGRVAGPEGPTPLAMRFHARPGAGTTASVEAPPSEPLKPLDDYASKVVRSRRRGLVYPYELESVLAGPGGSLVEYDLDDSANSAGGVLVPVDRPRGLNTSGIMAAVVTTPTALHPEGVTRVVLCGDPTQALGAVSEPECTRIIAAINLAEQMKVPVEWFTLSAGARISMDSGTENMDWVAAALKRIVEFTQAGGEINVVVAGINVGAQPYWNAEATMLMHTKGILVMTPDSAMVLTGKQSLDFSGGVSAEDNFGIGGYDRVMGPNGQAQYWAPDLAGAFDVLMTHYDHSYVVSGESRPRRATTVDPTDRDISAFPHQLPDSEFTTVGEIFSATANPDRKKPFDIRTVMRALADQDHPTVERWAGMADADTAVVQDAHLGGYPVCILGIESRPVPRRGFPPADGPDIYTAGTLFPRSSKKAARAINAASGNRPMVVLANLSGFDGSPDSMRNLQLEYGAEIGRAIVNFDGPIVFCVISRYHGGAFVVFSKALNPRMTVLALEGSYASVIGGAPAAAVVFAGEVDKRTSADTRVLELQQAVEAATGPDRRGLAVELGDVKSLVRPEKITEVAAEFDGIHDIHRAVRVGSVDEVVTVSRLRARVIEAIETDGNRN